MIKSKKPKPSLKKSANTKFPYSQYWHASYSVLSSNGSTLKFKSVICARSASFAREILAKKISNDEPHFKLKNIKISMFTKSSRINNKRLSILDWQDIQQCSFPNSLNILFKYNAN